MGLPCGRYNECSDWLRARKKAVNDMVTSQQVFPQSNTEVALDLPAGKLGRH